MIAKEIKTVSEITKEISQIIDMRFRFVRIAGEISGLRKPVSGHYYFILKDSQAQIRAVLFKNHHGFLSKLPKDGQQVVCDGRISVYEPRGEYQLIIDTIDFHGIGVLQIAFENLKQRLRELGYFDTATKKPLPIYIRRIVLITSPTGAVVHDFLTTCRRRNASVAIQILPVRVQGEGAAEEISKAIKSANKLSPDVIVLCRGGGSIEDLWPFNEERVAEAIHQSTLPVVTGIGHETDFTIADFCADVRAATPTAAAELLVVDQATIRERIITLIHRMIKTLSWKLDSLSYRMAGITRYLASFDSAFSQPTLRLDSAMTRVVSAMHIRVEREQRQLFRLESRLRHLSPLSCVHENEKKVALFSATVNKVVNRLLAEKQYLLKKTAAVLDSLSPLATLARGYSIVTLETLDTPQSVLVTDAEQVDHGDTLHVRLNRGNLTCSVLTSHGSSTEPGSDSS